MVLQRLGTPKRCAFPERLPVAGALVRVSLIEPRATPGCEARGDFDVKTGLDGAFTLPLHPDGKVMLEVVHDWYRTSEHEVTIGGPTRDLVVDRGATWTGHVLDPDGHAFAHCNIFVQQESTGYIKMVPCTAGFSFGALPQGDLSVSVHVERGVLGMRVLRQTVHVGANTQLRTDVKFPRGAAIAGVVIDAAGAPLPLARIDAIPKGTARRSDRFSEGEIQLEADANGHFELRHLSPGMWVLPGNHRGLAGHDFDIATGTIDVRLVVAK